MQIQIYVGEPDEMGRRQLSVYARPEVDLEEEWTLHADGILPAADAELVTIPADVGRSAEGAEEVGVDSLYERLADAGYDYGPAFQGLRRAWQLREKVGAEVRLADQQLTDASDFNLHPALLDSALHALAIAKLDRDPSAPVEVPFSLTGVHLRAAGSGSLRVSLGEGEGDPALLAFDEADELVLSIEAIETRPIAADSLLARRLVAGGDMFELQWKELSASGPAARAIPLATALADPAARPGLLSARTDDLIEGGDLPADDAEAAQELTARTLELIQGFLAEERFSESRLALLTTGALAVDDDEAPVPSRAALVGLMRSASSEHPGRFCLIDSDAGEASGTALESALGAGEPEIALATALHACPAWSGRRLRHRPPRSTRPIAEAPFSSPAPPAALEPCWRAT